jgi:hypothetical protein
MTPPRPPRRFRVVRSSDTSTTDAAAALSAPMPAAATLQAQVSLTPRPVLDTIRRVGESVIIAAVTSAGFYLVGSVYTDAFYSRLSIEVTSLDLAPPYIALQSTHALQGLLSYPTTLLFGFMLYRTLAAPGRILHERIRAAVHRAPRLMCVLGNLLVIAPLVIEIGINSLYEQDLEPGSVLSEAISVLGNASLVLLLYAIWLGWSQRQLLVMQIRARKLLPIFLLGGVFLLNAMVSTATVATLAAEQLLTGTADDSMGVVFTLQPGVADPLAGKELILVTARNGSYYVVERQPEPPSGTPRSFMVPLGSVQMAEVHRLHDANRTFLDTVLDEATQEAGEHGG